jgi:hypothetical protein
LGSEPPQYDPAEQEPHQYIQQLLQWGALPGASLEGCVNPPTADGQPAAVDLAALHAAGCFPHAWQVPLTAAGVQAANCQVHRASAASALSVLQLALVKGRQWMRQSRQVASNGEAGAHLQEMQQQQQPQPQQQQQHEQPEPQQKQQQQQILKDQQRGSAGKRKQAQPKHLSQQQLPPPPSPRQAQLHEDSPDLQPPALQSVFLPAVAPPWNIQQAWHFAAGGWIWRSITSTATQHSSKAQLGLHGGRAMHARAA